mmetsp:Transcript_30347/g.76750  ORF Transcript_30347/g.76750 Transcript_30347/m.76750 type:complete len:192 (+) Transcript_30347:63-638(+)
MVWVEPSSSRIWLEPSSSKMDWMDPVAPRIHPIGASTLPVRETLLDMLCLPNAEDGRRGHGCRQPERGESQGHRRHATSTGRGEDPCHATPHRSNIVAKVLSEVGPPLCLADDFVFARESAAAGIGERTIDAGLRRRSDLPWPQLYTCDFTDCEVENALVEHGFVMECPVCKFRAEKRQRVHRRSSLLVSL